jgi:glycine cleavage system H lipoate-binding protein
MKHQLEKMIHAIIIWNKDVRNGYIKVLLTKEVRETTGAVTSYRMTNCGTEVKAQESAEARFSQPC